MAPGQDYWMQGPVARHTLSPGRMPTGGMTAVPIKSWIKIKLTRVNCLEIISKTAISDHVGPYFSYYYLFAPQQLLISCSLFVSLCLHTKQRLPHVIEGCVQHPSIQGALAKVIQGHHWSMWWWQQWWTGHCTLTVHSIIGRQWNS